MDPVLVAGCGNAGFAAAMELSSRLDHPVVVVDPEDTMWFRSRYHRALESGTLDPVTLEVQPELSARGVSFRQDRLVDVDPDDRHATFASGNLRFAKLVVAVGAASRPSPTPGDGVLSFRDDLGALLGELSFRTSNRIAVVGGGTSGLHAAAGLACDAGLDEVVLVHGGDRILPSFNEGVSSAVHDLLEDRGVEVRTGARVKDVKDGTLALADGGTEEADLVLWCGGIRPRPLLDDLPLPTTDRGLAVDDCLRVGSENVYAAGDVAAYPEKTMDAYYGFHEARCAARNVARVLKGKDPKAFRLRWHPRSLYLGRGEGGLVVRGRLRRGWIPNLVRRHVVEDGYSHMLRFIW